MDRSPLLLWVSITWCVLTMPTAFAQTAPRTAAQELQAARQIVDGLSRIGVSDTTARKIDEIKQDFADLLQAYTAQAGKGADSVAPGPGESWRLKLALVNVDLRTADISEPATVERLMQLRARLDAFYTAAIGTESADASAAAPPNARALADRIQMLVDGILMSSGGRGDAGAQITVSRATLVEIQTAVQQLRAAMR